ncbi:MAG: hypothetical protein HKO04_15130 [Silicimonas sp.]|nr:hypothetical protein [Silicimonas sp.]
MIRHPEVVGFIDQCQRPDGMGTRKFRIDRNRRRDFRLCDFVVAGGDAQRMFGRLQHMHIGVDRARILAQNAPVMQMRDLAEHRVHDHRGDLVLHGRHVANRRSFSVTSCAPQPV